MLKLTDKLDLRRGENSIFIIKSQCLSYMEKYKSLYNNNEIKISAPTWNDKFELPDGPYSVSDIQNYFQYIIKKHGGNIDNPSVRKYVNKTENKFISKNKTVFCLELLISETMKLLGSTEENKDKMVKMCHTLKYQKQYQFIVILSIMIISKIQESCIHLFQINHLVVYKKFLQQILSLSKHLIQNFKPLKHDLQIKKLSHQKQKKEE